MIVSKCWKGSNGIYIVLTHVKNNVEFGRQINPNSPSEIVSPEYPLDSFFGRASGIKFTLLPETPGNILALLHDV